MASFVGGDSPATRSDETWIRQLELLHAAHYVELVRLAVALVDREDLAEEIVQESFLQLFQGWERLRDSELAPAYLWRAVINRSRDELRSRRVRRNHPPKPPDPARSSEEQVLEAERDRDVLQALAALPARATRGACAPILRRLD